ncbi:hypothetical protein SAMN05428970_2002 [Agromyces sp. CF514]|uniref:hypothetical protein n=1 Tax=Agromyces sp. CF514 TaxID=1881031 RepID=UPI0008DFE1EB|nr:hypothetical protein [Agromyces sp. CF514]SFR76001.1 hypothetical protein SAMN05428970_2002 [Agromyces sp. CF514]
MALADRKQLDDKKPAFERWIDSLSTSNRAVIDGWLADLNISNQRIADWIRDDDEDDDFTGYPAGKDTIAIARRARGFVRSA